MNKTISAIVGLSLALAGCGGAEEEDKTEVLLPNVKTEKIKVGDFEHWVELQGALSTEEDVMLTPQMSGVIRAIKIKEGQQVRKGQTIAIIDSDIISKNIDEVEAALDNAFYMLKKQRQLFEKGVGTEFDTTQAYNQVKALVKKRETLLTQAGKSVVVAPFNGYINDVMQKEGEVGAPQIPICHIVGLDDLTASAAISEAYLTDIKEGSPVRLIIPSLDTVIGDLKVDRVSHYVNPTNRTYEVHIDVPNEGGKLVPNLVTKVQVMDSHFDNVLIVPSSAIQYNKDGDTYIFKIVEKEGKLVSGLVMVEQLSSYKGETAVTAEGLNEDSQIVTVGAEGIEDNTAVNRMNEK